VGVEVAYLLSGAFGCGSTHVGEAVNGPGPFTDECLCDVLTDMGALRTGSDVLAAPRNGVRGAGAQEVREPALDPPGADSAKTTTVTLGLLQCSRAMHFEPAGQTLELDLIGAVESDI
jgi:hypothetical protein